MLSRADLFCPEASLFFFKYEFAVGIPGPEAFYFFEDIINAKPA